MSRLDIIILLQTRLAKAELEELDEPLGQDWIRLLQLE